MGSPFMPLEGASMAFDTTAPSFTSSAPETKSAQALPDMIDEQVAHEWLNYDEATPGGCWF